LYDYARIWILGTDLARLQSSVLSLLRQTLRILPKESVEFLRWFRQHRTQIYPHCKTISVRRRQASCVNESKRGYKVGLLAPNLPCVKEDHKRNMTQQCGAQTNILTCSRNINKSRCLYALADGRKFPVPWKLPLLDSNVTASIVIMSPSITRRAVTHTTANTPF
jgi:hypothetical protein